MISEYNARRIIERMINACVSTKGATGHYLFHYLVKRLLIFLVVAFRFHDLIVNTHQQERAYPLPDKQSRM